MKIKHLGITLTLAFAIILSGIIGLSFVYQLFFDAENIIAAQSVPPDSLAAGPELFLKEFIHPLPEGSTPLSEEQIYYYLTDSRSLIDATAYERLFELAGLPYDETYWSSLSSVDGAENYFVLEMDEGKLGGNSSLTVMLEDYMPVFLYHKSSTLPSSQEMETAVADLEAMKNEIKSNSASQASELLSYVEKLEPIFASSQKYHLWLNQLSPSLLPEDSLNQELSGETSLLGCCRLGTWEVYSTDQSAVLVCRMEPGYLVLFYDAAAGSFCGFHLGMSAS